jgi:hypothetical protein
MTSALLTEWPPVVELRQYTLRPGQREVLIDLFESELLEPQEEVGIRVLGQFRDLDRPDRFVWLRGFPDMAARKAALTAFYGGPVWARHRAAANATMLDSDDVLLLRPAEPGSYPATGDGRALLTAEVHLLREPSAAGFLPWYAGEVEPLLERAGSRRVALLETEPAANTFPRLAVREGVCAVVRLARFGDETTPADVQRRVELSAGWAAVSSRVTADLVAAPQLLRLQPTPRSALR